MNILFNILVIIISFILIIWGGDKFVDCSILLSKKAKVPTAVIGATITSIGTTLPELLVTIFSSSSNASGLAIGNALGSVIFNTCIIGGLLFVFLKLTINKQLKNTLLLFTFSILIISIMCLNKMLAVWECFLLLFLFAIFVFFNFKNAKAQNITDKAEPQMSLKKCILIFLLSATAIAVGAYFSVNSATNLAKIIGLSDTFIGLSIVCIGTSLPELITTITAIRKKEAGLGIGNIVGSNIINSTLLIGLVGIINGGATLSNQTLFVAIPFTLLSTAILSIPLFAKNKSSKLQGVLLFATYFVYYTILIFTTQTI